MNSQKLIAQLLLTETSDNWTYDDVDERWRPLAQLLDWMRYETHMTLSGMENALQAARHAERFGLEQGKVYQDCLDCLALAEPGAIERVVG